MYLLSLHDNIFCFNLFYKNMWIILLQRVLSRYTSEKEKYLQQIKIASVFCCSVQICICLIIRSNSWSVTNEDILFQWKNFLQTKLRQKDACYLKASLKAIEIPFVSRPFFLFGFKIDFWYVRCYDCLNILIK